MSWLLRTLAVLSLWVGSFRGVLGSLSFTIQPGEEECYAFRTPSDRNVIVTGTFECLDDDVEAKELSVSVSNYANGEILFEAPTGARDGSFRLDEATLKMGTKYSLCFQNNESVEDEENEFDVGFSIHSDSAPRSLPEGEIGPDGERALKLAQKAVDIQEDWTNLMDHYEFSRNRHAIHEQMNLAIIGRLTKWTYTETVVVILIAAGQVLYFKKFFEKRRYL